MAVRCGFPGTWKSKAEIHLRQETGPSEQSGSACVLCIFRTVRIPALLQFQRSNWCSHRKELLCFCRSNLDCFDIHKPVSRRNVRKVHQDFCRHDANQMKAAAENPRHIRKRTVWMAAALTTLRSSLSARQVRAMSGSRAVRLRNTKHTLLFGQ